MVDLSFLDKQRGNSSFNVIVIAVAIFILLLLLYMAWPWKSALILTLWGAYILWWPTVWLDKHIHRRGLSALIVIVVTGVVLVLALTSLTVIVAQQLAQLVTSASSSSTALSGGLNNTVGSGVAKVGPIAALISALATSGGSITSTFTGTARDVAGQVLRAIPFLLIQLVIAFFLLLGILWRGDVIVKDFKAAVPAKQRPLVTRFLDQLNPIYYTFFVIYVAVALICGILAAIIYGLLGVPYFVTFAVFIVFVGLIPSIGRMLIYIPLALWLIISGHAITGLLVLILSIVIFELILRYTIQPRWMERTGRVPRPISLIAYTFALVAFGPIGFALGPAIVGFALAMWRTWREIQREQEEQAPAVTQASGT